MGTILDPSFLIANIIKNTLSISYWLLDIFDLLFFLKFRKIIKSTFLLGSEKI